MPATVTEAAQIKIVQLIAKELGVLTVAVVTKPFAFEGKRQRIAVEGLDALSQHVDSLIIIPNDKLTQVLGNTVTLDEAFKAANYVLHGAVAGIAEIISNPGLINVDFADVRTVMAEMGMAMMGSAKAAGPDRARAAAEQAAEQVAAGTADHVPGHIADHARDTTHSTAAYLYHELFKRFH